MRNLIHAGFVRMMQDKVFWIMTIAMLALGLGVVGVQYASAQENGHTVLLDSCIFGAFLMVCVALAIFVPLFIGTEYSDGTMRNKLSTGAKRTHIYVANFITCALGGIIMELICVTAVAALGFALVGAVETPFATMLLRAAVGILLTLSLAAIFTLIAMLITSKAVSAIICLLISIVLLMVGNNLFTMLQEPEYYSGMVADTLGGAEMEDGEQGQYSMQYVENIPNPKYIKPEQRPLVQAIADILPTGQAQQLTSMNVQNPWLLMLYSAGIIVLFSSFGIFVFRRKDLK